MAWEGVPPNNSHCSWVLFPQYFWGCLTFTSLESLTDLFSRVLLSFLPSLLATPLPLLFWAPFRLVLSLLSRQVLCSIEQRARRAFRMDLSTNQKNPRAHNNKIGTSPLLPQTQNTPPALKREFYGHGGFPAERTQKFEAPIKLAQPFPAPELRTRILQTRGPQDFSEQSSGRKFLPEICVKKGRLISPLLDHSSFKLHVQPEFKFFPCIPHLPFLAF